MIGLYEGTAVIVQARLNSKRLFRKALLDLDGKPILYRVLSAMRELPAEYFILACDVNSKKEFQPIADSLEYICIGGPEADVLKRFCNAISYINSASPDKPVKAVVRVTADNPFLFVPAAVSSMRRYYELGEPDYFTYTGLPVGSGIEILKAETLLQRDMLSSDAYEREHVGPSVYRYPDMYRCIRETAPSNWYFPHVYTTVDTADDYEKAKQMMKYLRLHKKEEPFLPKDIVEAADFVSRLVVFSPSVTEGRGSGHLRRICDIINSLSGKVRCFIYIPEKEIPNFSKQILAAIPYTIIIKELPERAALIVLDRFRTSSEEMRRFKQCGPVAVIDEGGEGRAAADFILDILPSLNTENQIELEIAERANIFSPAFIPLPAKRKIIAKKKNPVIGKRFHLNPQDTKVLVVCGGENSYRMALPTAKILASLKFNVTALDINLSFEDIKNCEGKIKTYSQIKNLSERLCEWDLIVTHYGFTAFEALAAGCYVLLISPTEYHYKLALAAGFTALPPGIPSVSGFLSVFSRGIKIPSLITPESKPQSLPKLIENLSYGRKYSCPLCGSGEQVVGDDAETAEEKIAIKDGEIAGRTPDKTVARCPKCGMYYLSFIIAPPKKYTKSYFFDEYKAQYGKTYLEDFDSIRRQGLRRMEIIDKLYIDIFYKKRRYNIFDNEKKLLDVGCAYGPFISAAKYSLWYAVGTDVSEAAVQYVKETLKLPAFVSAFPALPPSFEFLYEKKISGSGYDTISVPLTNGTFAAVTMWFVIEHFQDLDSVLKKINALLMPGGIFAFSTPNFAGITGSSFPQKFFAQSPSDHYSIWDARTVKRQLEKYGFKVLKILSVGHHPERFKLFFPLKKNGILWHIVLAVSKFFKLGDSMEVYAMKHGTMEDIK